MVTAIKNTPWVLEMMEQWHRRVLPVMDLCSGSGSLIRFLSRYFFPILAEDAGIEVRFEVVLSADRDSDSRTFNDLMNGPDGHPLFSTLREVLADRATDYRGGVERTIDVPKTGSDGSAPHILSGFCCGANSSNNTYRGVQKNQCTIGRGEDDSDTSLTFWGTKHITDQVQSPNVMLENSPNIEGKSLPASMLDDMTDALQDRNVILEQLHSYEISHQARDRAYIVANQSPRYPERRRFRESIGVLMDSLKEKYPLKGYVMDSRAAHACPWVAEFAGLKRGKRDTLKKLRTLGCTMNVVVWRSTQSVVQICP